MVVFFMRVKSMMCFLPTVFSNKDGAVSPILVFVINSGKRYLRGASFITTS